MDLIIVLAFLTVLGSTIAGIVCLVLSVVSHPTARECPICGYDLRGHRGHGQVRCPECGDDVRLGRRVHLRVGLLILSIAFFALPFILALVLAMR